LGCEVFRNVEAVLVGPDELLNHTELKDVVGQFQGHPLQLSTQQERILQKKSSTLGLVWREFTIWKIVSDVYEEVSHMGPIDLVIMPCVDDCLEAIALMGSPFKTTPWIGILSRQRFHFAQVGVLAPTPKYSDVRAWLFRHVLHNRNLLGVVTNDETFADYARSHLNQQERRKLDFVSVPGIDHVLPLRPSAREALGIPQNAKVVLAYGALSERKGICSLVEAADNPRCPQDVCVLLAGEQSPEIALFLASKASLSLQRKNRLIIINKYISDSEEAELLAASDCMWVGYRKFYVMSGILILACTHGIPCLVSECGVAGYLMKKHQFGLTVDPDNQATILAALQELSNDTRAIEAKGRRGIAAFSRHSISEFQKLISAMIERAGSVTQ
jgi:glycosyltransferase involved in cell wall biosynthesis